MKNPSKIDTNALVDFTKRLIRIPSPSGEEASIARAVVDEMNNVGFDRVLTDELHNVLGIAEGRGGGRDLLLLAHTDHADVGQMNEPFSGKEIDGAPLGEDGPVIYGRGACDMKGALASMVYAVESLKRSDVELTGNVYLLAFTREERGEGEGLDYAVRNWDLKADMAVSGEATGLDIYIGHRGSMQFKIVAKGRSCHASNPSRGINAIYQMTKILGKRPLIPGARTWLWSQIGVVESMGSATGVRRVAVQLFPVMGHELVKPALLPSIGQLLEHIGEVWQRRHSVLGTGTHQAIERSGSAGGIVRARE